jgi:hypothetical protein
MLLYLIVQKVFFNYIKVDIKTLFGQDVDLLQDIITAQQLLKIQMNFN